MAPRTQKQKTASDTAIPCFTIDLSSQPEDRYVDLAIHYGSQIRQLTGLFDDLLTDLGLPLPLLKTIHQLAKLFLRKVHSPIETAELRGISRTARIPMYLLVSLNLILDLLMGCTSGAVRALEKNEEPTAARMLHFRTLDWGMDPLRSVIVQLDYIRSKEHSGRRILGSSITYVGFVGLLTGVRESLSLSLNFRAVHDASTKTQHFKFYFHHLLVLLGVRQSISSLLRSCLYGGESYWSNNPRSLAEIVDMVPSRHTTAAYLIFCDGKEGVTMEKDFCKALVTRSQSFIVTTNHDVKQQEDQRGKPLHTNHTPGMQDLLDESEDRRNCMVKKWKAKLRAQKRELASGLRDGGSESFILRERHTRSLRSGQRALNPIDLADSTSGAGRVDVDTVEQATSVTKEELIQWTMAFPTTNECTHFAAILDPTSGRVVWSQKYPEPLDSLTV